MVRSAISKAPRAVPASESVIPLRHPMHQVPIALGRRLYQIGVAASAEVVGSAGLIPLEFGTMIAIHEYPGLDQNTLAASLVLDRTTLSAVVFELEKKGFIEREVDDTDRRARKLRLTSAGQKLHDRLRPLAVAAQQRLLSVLSGEERKTLLELLVRVIEGNVAFLRPGAGRRKRSEKTTPKSGKGSGS